MSVKLQSEHHFEFLSLKGGCTGSSESTHVKIPLCWKSPVVAQGLLDLHCQSTHLGVTSTKRVKLTDLHLGIQ